MIDINSTFWFYWALLSAVFAALTAIFAKVGIQGIDSDLATLVRTAIVLMVLSAFVVLAGKWNNPFSLSGKTWLFLGLSALATGASWVCYFRALQLWARHPKWHRWISSVWFWLPSSHLLFLENAQRPASGWA